LIVYSVSLSPSPSAPAVTAAVTAAQIPTVLVGIKNEPVFSRNQQLFKHSLVSGFTSSTKENKIPTWNTLGRPKKAKIGVMGFNIETSSLEYWDGSIWLELNMKKI
jgi:hypothetical protein